MVEIIHGAWDLGTAEFSAALLNPELAQPTALTSAASGNDPRRFAVYRNNVTVGLVRAMEANFPAIVRLIGAEYFAMLARHFVQLHPPHTRMLFEYGSSFAPFLESFEPLKDYPYLADVARIEQAWREAFHEADCLTVTAASLAEVSPEAISGLVFLPHPAARLVPSLFAAGSIFVANREFGEAGQIDPLKAEWVLITRPVHDCAVRILPPAQGYFTETLLAGKTLATAAAIAFEHDAAFDLAAAIAGVVNSGAFAGFRLVVNNQDDLP